MALGLLSLNPLFFDPTVGLFFLLFLFHLLFFQLAMQSFTVLGIRDGPKIEPSIETGYAGAAGWVMDRAAGRRWMSTASWDVGWGFPHLESRAARRFSWNMAW